MHLSAKLSTCLVVKEREGSGRLLDANGNPRFKMLLKSSITDINDAIVDILVRVVCNSRL